MQPRSIVRGLVGASAVLLVALAFWSRARGFRGPAPDAAAIPARAEGARPNPETPAPPSVAPSSVPRAEAERSPASPELAAPTAGGLEVRVLADGVPVPGARVWLAADPALARELGRLREERADVERLLAVPAEERVSDAHGVARFAVPRTRGEVMARAGDRFAARGFVAYEPGPLVLALAPDPPIRVRVEDVDGRAVAGAPVGLRPADRLEDLLRARTDAEGLAVLHAGAQHSGLVQRRARVGLALLLAEPVEIAVDPRQPPAEPLVLRMPPTGSLEVTLVDERGVSFLQQGLPPATLVAGLSAPMNADQDTNTFTVPFVDGRARLEPVGLGLALELVIGAPGRPDAVAQVSGPQRAGERVEARVVLGPALPRIVGRLVDAGGRPFAAERIGVRGRSAGRLLFGIVGTVDSSGRFEAFLGEGEDPAQMPALTLDLVVRDDARSWSARAERATLEPDVTDLGTLTLAELVPRLAGRVVDTAGQPVRGATVRFYRESQGRWCTGEEIPADGNVDGRGRFALSEPGLEEPLGVQVEAAGFVSLGPRIVDAQTTEIELVLQQGGRIAYRMLYDGPYQPSLVLDPRPEPYSFSSASIGPLPPGIYTLRYEQKATGIAGSIPGVRVVAGETTTDARLDPLDLRGLAPTVVLTIVDADGIAVPEPVFGMEGHGPSGVETYRARRDGERWRVTAAPLPLHLWIGAPGFRGVELTDLAEDRRIVLERGLRFRWVVGGTLPELPEGWSLEGRLKRRGPLGVASPAAPVVLAARAVDVYVSAPGTYEASYQLVHRNERRELDRATFGEREPVVFEVAESNAPQSVTIAAPSPELVAQMRAYVDASE